MGHLSLSSFTCCKLHLSDPIISISINHHNSYSTTTRVLQTHHYFFPNISASSTNPSTTRAKCKVKSNAELCKNIRDFISVVGLPEGHVPSLKELSQHGRQDLANIVRRRGYKLIKQLLATSKESDENGQHELIGGEQKLEDMTKDVLIVDEVQLQQNHFESASGENIQSNFSIDGMSNVVLEYSMKDKVAKFIKSGELEDDGFDISHVVGADLGNGGNKDLKKDSNTNAKEGFFNWGCSGKSNEVKNLNKSKSQSKLVLLHAPENNSPKDAYFPNEKLLAADSDDLSDVEIRKRNNETEVNRLKFIIHQKELELSHLKEEIEKEKNALSLLHTEVEKEMNKAHKLVSEKDTELLASEDILSDLKEVQVQYMGDGETVQVAGSFNGWHHHITMDLHLSSNVSDPSNKSRNSRLWSTTLWLYPGIYQIKFVVDGNWRIDPQRETVTMGSIQNNILHVDR